MACSVHLVGHNRLIAGVSARSAFVHFPFDKFSRAAWRWGGWRLVLSRSRSLWLLSSTPWLTFTELVA